MGARETSRWRVAILGAGAGGLGLAIRLKRAGIHDFVIFEKMDGVGGTWRANTYPGAACDIQSHLYSFSFELKPDWTKSYADQPEILAYFEHCADKYGIRPHLHVNTGIVGAAWSDEHALWRLRSEHGDEYEAEVVVTALGMLNVPSYPAIDGLDDFAGAMYHSARWNHDDDLAGQRVAVMGTGASAAQIVPEVAAVAAHVDVFQRTPAWVLPRIDTPFSDDDKRRFARNPIAARRHRWRLYRTYERSTTFRVGDEVAAALTTFALSYLERRVPDPELRARLTPGYPIGCKRVLISSDFYRAIVRDNVDLVTDDIERITPTGIVGQDGREHSADTIVLATGFRATDYLCGLDVTGRDGRRLHDDWREVPHAYLGMTVSGYPNLFMLYGPNTNQGGNSLIFILEAQASYIVRALRRMRRRRIKVIDVKRPVMARYNEQLTEALRGTVWDAGCNSYFRTPSGRIATQLPHKSRWYWLRTRRFALADYESDKRPVAELATHR